MSESGVEHVHPPCITRHLPLIWQGVWYVEYGHIKIQFASSNANIYRWRKTKLNRKITRATAIAMHLHDAQLIRPADLPNMMDRKQLNKIQRAALRRFDDIQEVLQE